MPTVVPGDPGELGMERKFDLIVIGTGAGGATAAHKCRKAGWEVAIIDCFQGASDFAQHERLYHRSDYLHMHLQSARLEFHPLSFKPSVKRGQNQQRKQRGRNQPANYHSS